MEQKNKVLFTKYGICFGVASLIAFIVFWIRGFFTDSVSVNVQILSDGFYISGMIFLFVAAMMYISDEGGLIGIGYIFKSVIQIFVPMGRMNHERYADYRERKLGGRKKRGSSCILITGLTFFAVGVILSVIWYIKFYN